MTITRPYLLRGLYDWIVDNNCTPYVVVNAELENVQVPERYVEDGKIVLNISPSAVRELRLGNDCLEFSARFSGVPMHVYVPILAVMAVYAKENGRGMVFTEEEGSLPPSGGSGGPGDGPAKSSERKKSGRANLTVVK